MLICKSAYIVKRYIHLYSLWLSLLIVTACSSGGGSDNNNPAQSNEQSQNGNSIINRFYINQSVPAQDSEQETNDKVPLVAGKQGLLRVFATPSGNNAQEPVLRVHYRLADNSTGQIDIAPPSNGLSNQEDESTLRENYNYTINANLMQPGLQLYFELDPDNLIPEINDDNNRYPATGYISLDIRSVPTLDIVAVPINVNNGGAPSLTVNTVRSKLRLASALYPFQQINIRIHASISFNNLNNGDEWVNMLQKLADIRNSEVSNTSKTLYVGLIDNSPDGSRTAGIGYRPGFTSVSLQNSPVTIAHELGHNFNLEHAPCGGPSDPDASYPYSGAIIGISGYDILTGLLKSPSLRDLMSYCGPSWVSDYNYKKVYSYRQLRFSRSLYQPQAYQAPPEPEPVLMVSGIINHGKAEIKRVFQLQAYSHTSTKHDSYQLQIYGESDELLHTQSFQTKAIDHSPNHHFNIMVPATVLNGQIIKRLAIYHNTTLLTERQSHTKHSVGDADLYRIAKAETDKQVLSWQNGSLRIQWNNQAYESVMLRNIKQNTTLAINNTGEILLEASSLKDMKQLTIIYSDGLNSYTETLAIPLQEAY